MCRAAHPLSLLVFISFSHCLCPFHLVFLVVCQLVSHTPPPTCRQTSFSARRHIRFHSHFIDHNIRTHTFTYFSLLPLFPCLITITGLWVMRLIAMRATCRVCVLSNVSKSKSSSQHKTEILVTLKVFNKQEPLNCNDFLNLFRSGGIFYSLRPLKMIMKGN